MHKRKVLGVESKLEVHQSTIPMKRTLPSKSEKRMIYVFLVSRLIDSKRVELHWKVSMYYISENIISLFLPTMFYSSSSLFLMFEDNVNLFCEFLSAFSAILQAI